jgi:endoglucanase
VKPDIAIALEGTFASDVPGVPSSASRAKQGFGPEVRITDHAMIPDRRLVNFIDDIAKESGLPLQLAVKNAGGTDASRIQITGAGSRVTGMAVPVRYIHSPVGIARKSDIETTAGIIGAIIEKASRFTL